MKIKLISLTILGLMASVSSSQAGLLDSIKGAFHDCKGHCEEDKINCTGAATQKGSLTWCKEKCLKGNKKADDLKAYEAGVAKCEPSSSAPSEGMSADSASDAPAAE